MNARIASGVLNFVIDRLQVDDEWFAWIGRGFRWWSGGLAQRIQWAAPRELHGVTVATLHVVTDLLADVPMGATTWARLAAMNRQATLSAYVADRRAQTVKLHASLTVTEDNWPMARTLAVHAAALQVADAHAEAEELARAFGARVDATGHPERGRRSSPDEMLNVVDVYRQRGQQPPPYATGDLASLVHLEPRPWVMAANEPARLVADLAFATGRPARLELDISAAHAAVGTGLALGLWLPVEPDAAIVQRLNAGEVVQPDAHHLGAWCLDADRGLGFVAFVPSAACLPDLPKTLIYHAAGRNEWARDVLFPQ